MTSIINNAGMFINDFPIQWLCFAIGEVFPVFTVDGVVKEPTDATEYPDFYDRFFACSGGVISDAGSPLNGKTIQNFNNGCSLRGTIGNNGDVNSGTVLSHTHSWSGIGTNSNGDHYHTTSGDDSPPGYFTGEGNFFVAGFNAGGGGSGTNWGSASWQHSHSHASINSADGGVGNNVDVIARNIKAKFFIRIK